MKITFPTIFSTLISVSVCLAGPRSATHDGFYLSMGLGGSGGSITADITDNISGNNEWLFQGGGGAFDIKVGGCVKINLCLSGDLIASTIQKPNVELNGTELGAAEDISAREGLLGLGMTYYFMPINLFLSGTLGSAQFALADLDNPRYNQETSDPGLGFQLKVGKEWWVGDAWGLGMSFYVMDAFVNQERNTLFVNSEGTLTGPFIGLLFNATFN